MSTKPAIRTRFAPDVFEAFRRLVLSADVQKLAPLMGLRPGTLYNKAEGSEESHHQPTLRDVLLATQITGNTSVLDALDATFGRATFDCLAFESTSDEALLELLAKLGAESGEFHSALARGLAAKSFSPATYGAIRAQALDMVSALMTLVHRLEDLVDEERSGY
jgi:hypothetical protein